MGGLPVQPADFGKAVELDALFAQDRMEHGRERAGASTSAARGGRLYRLLTLRRRIRRDVASNTILICLLPLAILARWTTIPSRRGC